MRYLAIICVISALCVGAAGAQDTDGDGLPDGIEQQLGSDPSVAENLTMVYEDPAEEAGRLEVAHDLVAVHVGSPGRGRTVWRLQFTEPWAVRGDVALIVYIDADNDPETGRVGGGVQGTDLMLRPDTVSNHGIAAAPLMASAAYGDSLYLTLDAPVNVEGDEVAMRAYVLIQNRQNTSDSDSTPWFDVRAPASNEEAIAVPENHPLHRAPEMIERVRVRVPVDGTYVKAAQWLASEEWLPERKGFRSASCDSLNSAVTPGFECYRTPTAMMHAYELTGDRKFLEIAHVGFSYAVKRGGGAGKGGSVQLTLTPHAVYKLKQAGITSLDTARWEAPLSLGAGFVPVEAGEAMVAVVTVRNNRDEALSVSLRVEDVPEGWGRVEEQRAEVPGGEERRVSFELPAEAALRPGETVALSVSAWLDGEEVARRGLVLGCPGEAAAGGAVGLVAGAEDYLGPALERAGVDARRIESVAELQDFGVIFLGTQAHTVDAAGLQEGFAQVLQWVHGGGTLVISQLNDDNWRPEFLPGRVVPDEPNAESGMIVVPDHAIFAGLTGADALSGMVMYDSIREAEGWQVLQEDTSGRPAIIATDAGRGRILVVMPSVERYYTGESTCADAERAANYDRLFENIIAWALTGG